MKKIMFNDLYGLTKAVLYGRKTMTRRIVKKPKIRMFLGNQWSYTHCNEYSPYKIGEIVAIAQPYKDIVLSDPIFFEGMRKQAGWTNKMFVRADLMPHHIQITDIKLERLQAISFEDCLREGIEKYDDSKAFHRAQFDFPNSELTYLDPVFAFGELIDKVSGKGIWESNPFVFAYTFKLLD